MRILPLVKLTFAFLSFSLFFLAKMSSVSASVSSVANQLQSPFTLPALPYPTDALEPHMSRSTFSFHYDKHHQTYVTNLNNLIAQKEEYTGKSLEAIIAASYKDAAKVGVYNNAAQVWNHSFFWFSMKKNGGITNLTEQHKNGALYQAIVRDFGSVDKIKDEFKAIGASQFGSGWVWLVHVKGAENNQQGSLKIVKTANADIPYLADQAATPLFTCDVWEHAYYLDYQNKRVDFLNNFMDHLVNWEFAEQNYAQALSAQNKHADL